LQSGDDGESQVREEYRGKLRYLAGSGEEAWQDHAEVLTAVIVPERVFFEFILW
jgi:hypothetical protein